MRVEVWGCCLWNLKETSDERFYSRTPHSNRMTSNPHALLLCPPSYFPNTFSELNYNDVDAPVLLRSLLVILQLNGER